MVAVLMVYASVAVLASLFAVSLRKEWLLELFIADLMLSAVGAWVGGVMFGAFGPMVFGISIVACFGMALPLVFVFNFAVAPFILRELHSVDVPAPLQILPALPGADLSTELPKAA